VREKNKGPAKFLMKVSKNPKVEMEAGERRRY
jgi:hypothetical protein